MGGKEKEGSMKGEWTRIIEMRERDEGKREGKKGRRRGRRGEERETENRDKDTQREYGVKSPKKSFKGIFSQQ